MKGKDQGMGKATHEAGDGIRTEPRCLATMRTGGQV